MASDDQLTFSEESLPESNKGEQEEEDAPVLEGASESGETDSDGDDEVLYVRSAERNRYGPCGYRWSPHWLAPMPGRFARNHYYSRNHYYPRCLYRDDKPSAIVGAGLENPYYAGNPYYSGYAGNPYYSRCPYRDDKPSAIVGAGLENLGNTCFLNAVMQCFLHTVPFLHGILSDEHSNCDKESFCLICAVRLLINHSLTRRDGPVAPLGLVNNLSCFKRFQQEDAHEFLQCFLDRLESCHVSSHSNNMVKQIFGGRLVSKLKCCSCGHCSDTYEPLIDLSLEIEDADNLLTALQSFTKVEIIEDLETKFTCEKCKEHVSIEKKLSFDQSPTVALFQLKRFKNDGCFVHKMDKHVEFPLELDLQPFMLGGNNISMELKYVLYAVVVHVGLASTSGHYYCFIRLSPGTWCKFDDSKVVLVSENYVLSQEAYILYYAKEDTTWFSSFVETQEYFSLESKALDTSPKTVLDKVHTSPPSPSSEKKSSRDCKEVSCDIGSELREDDYNNETKDSVQMHENLETSKKTDDNPHGTTTLVEQPCAGPSLDIPSPKAPKEVSSTFCEKLNRPSEEGEGAANNQINPQENCPRSPSSEIYREDPPDAGIMIPRDHLKTVTYKRQLEKDMDDAETKQAYSLIRSMPSSRGQQMMAALMRSKFKAHANRRKSRKLGKGDSSIRPVIRPLMAGIHR
ncbi:ubiquitin carboxyl-terminal hydrolase [Striga asiatica]|uniref:Ubiquitin carboxyl-terminal hydrolase n=1 Tax=Striga asiatica TaxID=4170 RepID=A0A5A7PPI7_STRAF|nr:ubiquitin carboxyl-terminal hydrolase [Striga asiatica]